MEELNDNNEALKDHNAFAIDYLLQEIVELTNKTGVGSGITLCCSGLIVSGQIIPAKLYLDKSAAGMADAYRKAFVGSEHAEDIAKGMGSVFSKYKQIYDEENFSTSHVGYIHLDHARIFSPGQQALPRKGFLWRGRLEAISAYSFGELSL